MHLKAKTQGRGQFLEGEGERKERMVGDVRGRGRRYSHHLIKSTNGVREKMRGREGWAGRQGDAGRARYQ